MVTKESILEALRPVEDPELGMSIIDIGLVYRAEDVGDAIEVDFTLTYPGCPLGDQIQDDIVDRLARTFNTSIRTQLVFEPAWTPARMSEEARVGLGYPI
ncbi:MAG TPA: metal-sulfur cluster assembly factor [Rectinemataceae bacterium]|nr:metal-sulfur cluster assembly factor [Rectinemataceae bacterium]